MKLWQILLIVASIAIGPICVLVVKYSTRYSDPADAWKCKWIEPIDPADRRACAAIPDKWLGDQFARCMVLLNYNRQCPEEVKP